MNMREQFEARFPTPAGVEWDEANQCYKCKVPSPYLALWMGWTAALVFAEATGITEALMATRCPGHGRSECVSCCWPKVTWNGLGLPPVGLPVEAYFPQDTQPGWLETTLLYVSDENVIYDDPGMGEILKTRAEFDDLNVQFRAVQP